MKPTTGATDFAVKIEVPEANTNGTIKARVPDSGIPAKWTTLTAAGQIGRGTGDDFQETNGLISSFSVSLADLMEKTASDGSTYWLLPMRSALGMDYYTPTSEPPVGSNVGEFNVSGIIAITYY